MLFVYRILINLILLISPLIIFFRILKKKEDPKRFKEKFCYFSKKRIEGKLLWFHGASVGEILSILPILEKLESDKRVKQILITSNTVSSSRILLNFNLKKTIHQFFPIDTKSHTKIFLEYWKPSVAIFIDSEIWPNTLHNINQLNIPSILLNARITKKTFNKWRIIFNFAKRVFGNFDFCLAASEESKNNLNKLHVKNLKYIGNLKYSAKNTFEELEDYNKKILDNFQTWCAASTHKDEEIIVLKTHLKIKKKYDNILTIIIPRHINRSSYIKDLSNKFNLNSQILNDGDLIKSNTEILIINSFGVISKYFNYCNNILVGKSFIKKLENISGQNPIEAAKLGCKIFHGPYVYNFQEIYEHLSSFGVAEKVNNELELAQKIIINFEGSAIRNPKTVNLLNIYGEKILKETAKELHAYLK